MFNKKSKDFKAWIDNGKYYVKVGKLGRTQEITKEQFDELLSNETIHSLRTTRYNQKLGIAELIELFNQHCDTKSSEFGRRVRVVLLEEEQKISKIDGGVDVRFKLDIIDEATGESADDLFTITSEMEGITGPLTDKGVYYPEAFRAMYQLAFNGYLSVNDEHEKGKAALKF